MIKIFTKKILAFFCLAVLVFALLLAPSVYQSFSWQKAASAAGGLPYQIGLTNAIIIKCFVRPLPPPPTCMGGSWCNLLDVQRCPLYSDVTGVPAGGMGNGALFSNLAILASGLTPGGQLIAGGISPVLMDSGVLASAGGCYGCLSKDNLTDKFFNWLDKYIIAGFKGSKK